MECKRRKSNCEFQAGEIAIYAESGMRDRVLVLENRCTSEWDCLRLKLLENLNHPGHESIPLGAEYIVNRWNRFGAYLTWRLEEE